MRHLNCFSMLIVLQLSCFIKFVDNQMIESHNRFKRNHEDSHDVYKTNNDPLTNKNDNLHDIPNSKSPNIRNHVSKPRKHKKNKAHRKRPLNRVLPSSGPKTNSTSQTINDTAVINIAKKEETSNEAVLNQETIVKKPANEIIVVEDTKSLIRDGKTMGNQGEVLFESKNEHMAEWQPSDHTEADEGVVENDMNVDSRFVDNDVQPSLTEDDDELPMKLNNIEAPALSLNVMPLVYPNALKMRELKKPIDIVNSRIEIKDQERNNFVIPNVENADLVQIENITSEEYSEKLSPNYRVCNEFNENPSTNYKGLDNAPPVHSTTRIPPIQYYVVDCNAPNNQYGYGNRVYYPTEVRSNIGNSISTYQRNRRYRKTRGPQELYDRTWKKTQRLLYRFAVKKNKLNRFPKSL